MWPENWFRVFSLVLQFHLEEVWESPPASDARFDVALKILLPPRCVSFNLPGETRRAGRDKQRVNIFPQPPAK